MKRILIPLILALLVVGTAAAQTVTYWHTMSDAETTALATVIQNFEAANPGITVKATRYAYDDFKSALLTSLAGGEAPDTARLDIIWVPEFAELGASAPLDAAMNDFAQIADGVFPGPLATNHWKDHYYGLPQDTNTQVLLWNKADFDAAGLDGPPATLDAFKDDACKLTKGDQQYGFALGGTYFWAPAPIFYAMGGKVVDDAITTADGYINGPQSVAAFQLLVDLYTQGCLSPNLLGGGIGTSQGHGTGQYAMIIDGPWMSTSTRPTSPTSTFTSPPSPRDPTARRARSSEGRTSWRSPRTAARATQPWRGSGT